MSFGWILGLGLLAVLSATPVTISNLEKILSTNVESTRNAVLEQGLLDGLESLRDVILNGADGIPPLDPYYLEELTLDDDVIPFPGASLELNGVKVLNLGSFIIDDLKATMSTAVPIMRYRVEIDGRIPTFVASAEHYDLSVSAMGANIFGAGDAEVKLINPRLKINVLARVRLIGGIFVTLEEADIQFKLDGFESKINGLFHHEGASDFVNTFLEDLVPSLVDNYQAEITKFLSENGMEVANEILQDLDLREFM